MSIKLMSAIFETEFVDLKDESGNSTKASTAKLVLLSLADHANDEGEGAYPGLTKMEKKTALTRQCIINTYDALKYNGIIKLEDAKSKFGTNNYTINTQAFPMTFDDSKSRLLVNPVDGGGNPGLLGGVIPVYPNHPLTVLKTPIELTEKEKKQANAMVTAIIESSQKPDNYALISFEAAFGFGKLPWSTNTVWTKFEKFVASIPSETWGEYVKWSKNEGKYKAFSNRKIRENPQAFMDTGYPEFKASKMYSRPPRRTQSEFEKFMEEHNAGIPSR